MELKILYNDKTVIIKLVEPHEGAQQTFEVTGLYEEKQYSSFFIADKKANIKATVNLIIRDLIG